MKMEDVEDANWALGIGSFSSAYRAAREWRVLVGAPFPLPACSLAERTLGQVRGKARISFAPCSIRCNGELLLARATMGRSLDHE